MTDFDPGPLSRVDYHADGDRWTLVFKRHLRHPPERVWAALTEKDRIVKWGPYAADRDLQAGSTAVLTMLDGSALTDETSETEVRTFDPPRLLEYTWDEQILRWELAADGDGTALTLSHTVEDRPWLPKVAAGWHLCVVALERHLDGEDVPPIAGSAAMGVGWQELHDQYAERLD